MTCPNANHWRPCQDATPGGFRALHLESPLRGALGGHRPGGGQSPIPPLPPPPPALPAAPLTPGCRRRRTSPAGPAARGRSAPRRARGRCAGYASCAGARGARGAGRAAPPGSSRGGCGSPWTVPSGWCPTLEGREERGLEGPAPPPPLHLLLTWGRLGGEGSPVPM